MKKILFLSVLILAEVLRGQNYLVTTIAGNGTPNLLDGIGTASECNAPYELCSDGANTIYFCDTYNHVVRKYDKATGQVTTIAGTGVLGFQDGPSNTARFNYPEGIVVKNNLLIIGDNYNHRIRQIDMNTNMVTTIAGTGTAGHLDGSAATAKFKNPKFLTQDKNGDIYISDYANNCVRKLSNGQVTTIAGIPGSTGFVNGPGATAKFGGISDLCIDTATGNIYLTDNYNNVIRMIDPLYNVSTYVGTGTAGHVDGSSTTAQFDFPSSLDLTTNRVMYVTGGSGGDNSIRKIDSARNVTTVAGNIASGFQDGLAAAALFNQPYGVCYDNFCNIYIADSFNHRLRRMTIPEGPAGCTMGMVDFEDPRFVIQIYPNPSSGIFKLALPKSGGDYSYKITDSFGNLVMGGSLRSTEIDCSSLVNGVYIIAVTRNLSTVTSKISVLK